MEEGIGPQGGIVVLTMTKDLRVVRGVCENERQKRGEKRDRDIETERERELERPGSRRTKQKQMRKRTTVDLDDGGVRCLVLHAPCNT